MIVVLKKLFKAIISLVIGFSLLVGFIVYFSSTQLVHNSKNSGVPYDHLAIRGLDYDKFCQSYVIEKVELNSTLDGHIIPADYIYAKGSNNSKDYKTIILVHGLGGNRYANYHMANFFLNEGYNVVLYDQRSTNENTAKHTTFGYLEKFDLIDYIDYVRGFAPEKQVGVWGNSFGGATSGLAMNYENNDEKIDFLILDCPVGSMDLMIEKQIKDFKLGKFAPYIIWCGNFVNKMMLGFSYEDTNVSKALENISIPVLVINSERDWTTPYFMGKNIYDSIKNNKKLLWTTQSNHGEIYMDNPTGYREMFWQIVYMVR